jgi:ribosome-associated toxin RatA of RatAB toxin-antitoxin module
LQVVERSAIVTHTAAQMFALVNDVARYPEFLPWCAGARVEEVSERSLLATVTVARGMLRMDFTTRNTLEPGARILMELADGPFRFLRGEWRFEAIGDRGSRVNFRVEFEFKNKLMGAALSSVFESVCATTVEGFVHRAHQIYREEPLSNPRGLT